MIKEWTKEQKSDAEKISEALAKIPKENRELAATMATSFLYGIAVQKGLCQNPGKGAET